MISKGVDEDDRLLADEEGGRGKDVPLVENAMFETRICSRGLMQEHGKRGSCLLLFRHHL